MQDCLSLRLIKYSETVRRIADIESLLRNHAPDGSEIELDVDELFRMEQKDFIAHNMKVLFDLKRMAPDTCKKRRLWKKDSVGS